MSNNNNFATPGFGSRVGSMLRLDFYRLFHTPLFYIMVAIAAIIPAMVLALTSVELAPPPSVVNNPNTVNTPSIEMPAFDYAFMMIESSEAYVQADNPEDILNLAGFANINMLYIFAGILMAIFVAHDYSSGYIKNIFTVHSKKVDYVISKCTIGLFSGAWMIVAYLIGTIIAGIFTGKSFMLDPDGGVLGLIFCLISKAFVMGLFCPLYLGIAIFFKNKLWITIIVTFILGMMFYPAASQIAHLNAGLLDVIMALAGGILGLVAFGSIGTAFLKKRDLV